MPKYLSDDFDGVITVTVLWVAVYYWYLFIDAQGRNMPRKGFKLAGQRLIGNITEQAFPFLLSLWMYALAIDPIKASHCGIAWLCFRLWYPIAWAIKGEMTPIVALATIPGYSICWYMVFSTFCKTAFDADVHQIANSVALAVFIEGFLLFFTLIFAGSRGLAELLKFGYVYAPLEEMENIVMQDATNEPATAVAVEDQ